MAVKGLKGDMHAEPRLFGHDAVAVTAHDTNAIANTTDRGCCLYIGGAGNVKVKMESGNAVTFNSVNAGTFLPILVTQVYSTGTTATNILAIF